MGRDECDRAAHEDEIVIVVADDRDQGAGRPSGDQFAAIGEGNTVRACTLAVTQVDFFANGTKLGTVTGTTSLFTFDWSEAIPGTYTLTAVATDDGGKTTESAPVTVTLTPQAGRVNLALLSAGSTGQPPIICCAEADPAQAPRTTAASTAARIMRGTRGNRRAARRQRGSAGDCRRRTRRPLTKLVPPVQF